MGLACPTQASNQLYLQYDFISDQQRALDGDGTDANADDPGDDPTGARSSYHGSHVAGTIGAATDNSNGVAGVNWRCKLMTLRALGLNGNGSLYDISQAILYAAGQPSVANGATVPKRAHVINMSLGGSSDSFTLRDAVQRALGQGVIIVASAGNDNVDTATYPAWYDGVINVGAVDLSGDKAPYSNYGDMIRSSRRAATPPRISTTTARAMGCSVRPGRKPQPRTRRSIISTRAPRWPLRTWRGWSL